MIKDVATSAESLGTGSRAGQHRHTAYHFCDVSLEVLTRCYVAEMGPATRYMFRCIAGNVMKTCDFSSTINSKTLRHNSHRFKYYALQAKENIETTVTYYSSVGF